MAATLPSRRPPHQKAVSPQRVAQYDPYAHQLGSLSENIHRLLTERECAIYDRGLTDYHRRRHIRAFVECLSLVLNTNQKRQLLIPIRDSYIKPSDLQKFNQLALELGLAAPLKKRKSDSKDGVKKVEIKRNPDGEWGFNIRGGSEHGIGIFVSSVERGSNAEKAGLKAGDQIKKANDLNCDSVTHQEAVSMMRNSKKLQLWVLSRGHVPTSRMAHKVYNWVDLQGRPASPPPDPFEVQEQISSSSRQLMNQPDERKVTMMIENGQELGISIRGGAEHGLGIYISAVEDGSVAEAYGVNVGDQILEVNGISFLGIVHSDAAHALRAQPCMVMKLKDVGKLPHSRVTTLGKTQWHSTGGSRTLPHKGTHSPVFTPGYGTQMMLSNQENSFQVRGMMNEVARSVLTSLELNTFNYYVNQYDQKTLSIDDLVTPMLHLLNTPEKLQLLSEMHIVIKPRDLQRFNELTVHKALAVKKAGMYHGHPDESHEGSFTGGALSPSFKQHSTPKSKGPMKRSVVAQVHAEDPRGHFQINPYENEDHTITHDSSSEEGGRDKVPQKLSPRHPTFHAPPPPLSAPTHGHAASKDNITEDTWSAAWNETSMMSPPPKGGSSADADSSVNISEIEDRVRSETETRLRQHFEEQQKKVIDEQKRKLKQEQVELEEKIRREAEESMKKQLREKEEALARMAYKNQENSVDKAQLEEEIKRELEEKIWKEAEEHLKVELEKKMQRELEAAKSDREVTDYEADSRVSEEEIRHEMEEKYRHEYEERIRREQEKWKRKEQEERRKQEQEAKLRQEAEIARLESEEQAKIELEERIRREAEASARAEYEARLQHETEERARLAEEVKARKAMEERMEKERKTREKEERERERQREREREQDRKRKERELASARPAAVKKPPPKKDEVVRDAAEEEEDENSEEEEEPTPRQMTPEEQEEQRMLEVQRRRRIQEQKEEQRREEAQKRALAAEKAMKDEELAKKRELARKREENIRKMEVERKQKEAEARQRREEERKKKQHQEVNEKQNTIERERQLQSRKKQDEEAKRQRDRAEADRIHKQKEQEQSSKGDINRLTRMGGKQVMVSGAAKNGMKKQALSPKSKAAAVEQERNKAEEMLEKKLREKREAAKAADGNSGPSFSYAGYNDLRGELKHVLITKVVRKLGIAIDGGVNTKQKAIIIREISPEGCAGQTAPELKVNQQLLEIEGQSLHGHKHKDVVMCIKHAFEGELGKVIDFTVLDPFN